MKKIRRYSPVSFVVTLTALVIAACSSYEPLRPAQAQAAPGAAVEDRDDFLLITAEAAGPTADHGIVFYPGGLVEPEAYVSMLAPLAAEGVPVAILRVPFDLAVFGVRRAERVLESDAAQRADQWVLAGHSLGGAMAGRFLNRHAEDAPIAGIILLASYPADNDSLATSDHPVLSIWAENDGLATEEDRAETAGRLPQSATVAVIEGGNHAGFGEYGPQDDDGERTISLDSQHEQTRALIRSFLDRL
ncbi:MAG: alpha/beta hydrolase [Spirochaetales bacterium]